MVDCTRLVEGSLGVKCWGEKRAGIVVVGMREGREVWQGDLYQASVAQKIKVPWEHQLEGKTRERHGLTFGCLQRWKQADLCSLDRHSRYQCWRRRRCRAENRSLRVSVEEGR